MTLLEEVARLLGDLALGDYRAGPGGNVFFPLLPPSPDLALAVARYPGPSADSAQGWDTVAVQVRVRGPKSDSRIAEQRADDVYGALLGLRSRALPGGTWLALCRSPQGGPAYIGQDANGRHEWVVNLHLDVRRPTAHRV